MSAPAAKLPFGAAALLRLLSREGEAIAGDLAEAAGELAATDRRAARRWLWRQLFASLAPLARRRAQSMALPLAAAGLAGVATFAGLAAVWRRVLFAVPLRADAPPPPSLWFAALAAVLAAAAAGFAAGRALDSPGRLR